MSSSFFTTILFISLLLLAYAGDENQNIKYGEDLRENMEPGLNYEYWIIERRCLEVYDKKGIGEVPIRCYA